jgi:hypothetical protein
VREKCEYCEALHQAFIDLKNAYDYEGGPRTEVFIIFSVSVLSLGTSETDQNMCLSETLIVIRVGKHMCDNSLLRRV